jgi:peptide chain release factor 1
LRSRLYEQELAKKEAEDATKRTSQVSSGDRSAKIEPIIINKCNGSPRWFDFIRSWKIMNGDIQKIVDELALVNNMEKLKEASEVLNIQPHLLRLFLEYTPVLRLLNYIF